jgi:hypothetical protein
MDQSGVADSKLDFFQDLGADLEYWLVKRSHGLLNSYLDGG